MATQGVVSVVSEGKVVMKVVAGCNGMMARATANRLRKSWPMSAEKAYGEARNTRLGCISCLTVVTESDILFKGHDELSPRYRETFDDAKFNPRWQRGIADHTIVVEV